MVEAKENIISVEIKAVNMDTPVKIKKNSTPLQIREAPELEEENPVEPKEFEQRFQTTEKKEKTFPEKLGEVQIDQAKSMTDAERKLFVDTLRKHEDVLGEDPPEYNDYFGVVKASIKFASRARPVPHKTRLPSYG